MGRFTTEREREMFKTSVGGVTVPCKERLFFKKLKLIHDNNIIDLLKNRLPVALVTMVTLRIWKAVSSE